MINVFAEIVPKSLLCQKKTRGPVSILSVLFFIPFCRFRGNNRFEGERFPTEEVVIVFRCVTSIV